ncbi:MAG: dienelactone hydrolase family protein [Betaproteobacteria bacterium]|nr:dienelactone hydrolase family protein [Betaproteobacteria bacterium]
MGRFIELTASDGHWLGAYRAEPAGTPKGALVVAMEIFGVNSHIRSVADGYAADGYLVIAPALFDRAERNYETGYSQEDIQRGIAMIGKIDLDKAALDVASAVANVAGAGKVGMVGYCWGGTVTWKAACAVDGLACAVPYYGGGVPGLIGLKPKCPVMFHWGESDASIPLEKAREFAAAHADQIHHFYAAGHGFNCDQRGSYDAEAARLARTRTLEFLGRHVG